MAQFRAGQTLTASALENIIAPGWTTYTVAWTSDGTAPAIGNGTLKGRYRRPTGADQVQFSIAFKAGSTTTFGTGRYSFSLPFATADVDVARVFTAYLFDTGTANKDGIAIIDEGDLDDLIVIHGTTDVTATAPHTWANGDAIYINGLYRPA